VRVILTETQLCNIIGKSMLSEYNVSDGNANHNPYKKKFDRGRDLLQNLLETQGRVMTNIENAKDYYVFEVYALSQLLGLRYCLCRAIKEGEAVGTVMLKPLSMFKIKNY